MMERYPCLPAPVPTEGGAGGSNQENTPGVWVMVTKPLPTGRQAFRLLVTVTCKELRDDKRTLLFTVRASLPLPLDFYCRGKYGLKKRQGSIKIGLTF
jgi:hypothetical protein